ncbi:MAG: M20/M25/M40 family metallo-hydrolase [Candidatus Hodarchaeales archaeon]|jgi:succinyl-diaminopimelate desuccinylase
MSQKETGLKLLRYLIDYKTVNNPGKGQFPDSNVISFVQETLLHWNSEIKSKIFETENYSSIYMASDLTTPKDIVFLGHLDVVPVTSEWDSNPFELTIKNKVLGFGRGSKDCKGSVVSALLFIKKINVNRKTDSLVNRIGLFLSTDEESGGQYGAKEFFEYAKENSILPKYIINVDGGPKVVFKRRAGFNLRLKAPPLIKKTTATVKEEEFSTRIMFDNNRHSAYFVPGVDSHALLSLSKYLHINSHVKISAISGEWVKGNVIPSKVQAKVLDSRAKSNLKQLFNYDENLTKILRLLRRIVLINIITEKPSEFGVTVNPNILTYSATKGTELQFDVRAFLSPKDKEQLISAVSNCIGDLASQFKIECRGSSGYFYTDPSDPLVLTSTEVMKEYNLMDEDELPKEQEGASDARYATMFGVPAIDIGPKGGNIHGDNEYIDLESMIQFSSIYEDIVRRLLIKD